MITEDYVSFETAKLLKEKGFYGECLSMYLTPKPHCGMGNPNEPKIAPHGRDSHYYEGYLYQCEAPTLQTAMKWLREVHKICIVVYPFTHRERGTYTSDICTVTITMEEGHLRSVWNNYEEACEAAIKYSLENLI